MKKQAVQTIQRAVPIMIIMALSYLASLAGLLEDGVPRVVEIFLGTFFVAMSLLKCINLQHFVGIFQAYDLVGRHIRFYAYAYPFIELVLGLVLLGHRELHIVSVGALVFILVTMVSIAVTLVRRQHPRCACMGTVFYMEITWFSFVEYIILLTAAWYLVVQHTNLL